MEPFPDIRLDTQPRSSRGRATHRRSASRQSGRQQVAWVVAVLAAAVIVTGGVAFHELSKQPEKRHGPRASRTAHKASALATSRSKSAKTSKDTRKRKAPVATTEKAATTKAIADKSITAEQFASVPQGALRFRVEDIFGSALHSTHNFEEIERFGSRGEIFGSEFVNTFMLAYRVSDRPGRIAVFIFQGPSTNPPLVEKQIQGE